ncbi:MAG: dUTP diphosphatase [Pseudomonadota bacterium]
MQTTKEQAIQMLNTMASMQDEHNKHVHPDWRNEGYEYYRAIWVECAEMLDHFGWKWWKKQTPDLDQVKLELVDIWHFALSELLRSGQLEDSVADLLAQSEIQDEPSADSFRTSIEQLAESTLRTRSFVLDDFVGAMTKLPMTYAELYSMYVGKNVLNNFRQAHGYKDGTYQKLWQGREDNEHLVEVLNALETRGTFTPQDVYQQLEARYPG